MGIVEIIIILAVALIVIPPENLPDVMRAAGKILRELRLASNMVMREIGGALDQPSQDQVVPPINPMRPASSVNTNGPTIAQTAPSADSESLAASVPAPAEPTAISPSSVDQPPTPVPPALKGNGPKAPD